MLKTWFLVFLILITGCVTQVEGEEEMRLTASQLTPMRASQSAPQNSIIVDDLEPGTYTLQFSVIGITPSPINKKQVPPDVQAIVTWKVGGQQQRRVISVVSGASITSVATGVDVRLVDSSSADTPYDYSVQATLSWGTRANTQQPPQLSGGSEKLAAVGSFAAFLVPQDSGVVNMFMFIQMPPTVDPQSIIVRQFDAIGFILSSTSPPANDRWVPVNPRAFTVEVINNSAVDCHATVTWGIDG